MFQGACRCQALHDLGCGLWPISLGKSKNCIRRLTENMMQGDVDLFKDDSGDNSEETVVYFQSVSSGQ